MASVVVFNKGLSTEINRCSKCGSDITNVMKCGAIKFCPYCGSGLNGIVSGDKHSGGAAERQAPTITDKVKSTIVINTTVLAVYGYCGVEMIFGRENRMPGKPTIKNMRQNLGTPGGDCASHADAIQECVGQYSFIVVDYDEKLFKEFMKRGLPYIIAVPGDSSGNESAQDEIRKEWFERYIKNKKQQYNSVEQAIEEKGFTFDVQTSADYLGRYKPAAVIKLGKGTSLLAKMPDICEEKLRNESWWVNR